MIRTSLILVALAALAACGVDGEPETPTVSANIGVGSSGISTNVGVGMRAGPVAIRVGL